MNFINQVIWAQKFKNQEFLAQKIETSQFLDLIFRNPMYRIPLFWSPWAKYFLEQSNTFAIFSWLSYRTEMYFISLKTRENLRSNNICHVSVR